MKIKFSFLSGLIISLLLIIGAMGIILFVVGTGAFKFSDGTDVSIGDRAMSMFFGVAIFLAACFAIPLFIQLEVEKGMIEADPGELWQERVKKEMEDTFHKFMSEEFKDIHP